ncbi:MAG: hypothetical protein A3G49_01530 [Candidatus Sungbacteria bacterium RIFCSPLOWO2_12_FULL_41_11]|uniref:DUF4258 domain-containing protein n=1 Tax=Candidatus Sungbacteria bacterium RIFCSPLOWO2_12_FULL_41_11 TaxID=1802286 RepID=A0A1G2LQV0_9BACT|nr:MAG: hypothetical protein UV01_C0011G0025 [Parcubacteria group bacterium GW2011_GWA2_42_14]OGZ97312.1 MAG: hypothetical protein A3D41_04835 [Candidatus Sungbacteria bacterium RIFCSPHIGHO2_02_FULL_41_12b]OHA13904.1 MAG: hypothetical protein A3G49_01530 [Candidatus Sungbacteria bacterium RIFCSPLOWO2_12_FULL_41_11]
MAEDLPIIFSRHALLKLEHRNLTKEMVVAVITKPSYLILAGDKFHAYRRLGKLYLKVIFVRTTNVIIVLTQHFVKKVP